jgi:hypothetical protein
LRGVVREEVYHHLQSFSVAICILCNPDLSHHFDYAGKLLKYVVLKGAQLYGTEFLVHNVNSLLHLADQAKPYGSLDECSAFAFESFLGRLKLLVTTGKNPLVQAVHRLDSALLPGRFVTRDGIKCKSPNNVFVVGGKGCVVLNQVADDIFHCKVYLDAIPVFTSPMSSLDLGKFKCPVDSTARQTFRRDQLTCRAMMFPHSDFVYFHTLIHSLGE